MAKVGRPRKYPTTWVSSVTGIEWIKIDTRAMSDEALEAHALAARTYNENRAARERLRLALSKQYGIDLDLKWNRFGISITKRKTTPAAKKPDNSGVVAEWLSEKK